MCNCMFEIKLDIKYKKVHNIMHCSGNLESVFIKYGPFCVVARNFSMYTQITNHEYLGLAKLDI
jgi:hypothetical protein